MRGCKFQSEKKNAVSHRKRKLIVFNTRSFANTINNYTKKLVRERERRERADTEKSKSRSDSFFF